MNRTTWLAGAALLSLAACKPQPITPADETAIRAVESSYMTATNAGNTDGVLALYVADPMDLPPNMPPVSGTEAMRKFYGDMFKSVRFVLTLNPTKIAGSGDLAYATGTYHFTGTMNDSTHTALPADDGHYVDVLARQADGSWKIVLGSWSSNAAQTAAAPAPPARPARRH